jgi:hypothetical protein
MAKKLTTSEFIKQANIHHNDKFDYSLTNYLNSKTHVTIICPSHGSFVQTPSKHLKSEFGCSECAIANRGLKLRLSPDEFLRRAIEVHGDRYDYSNMIFNSTKEKITIICKVHGEFRQRPLHHLSSTGCSLCSNELKGINQTGRQSKPKIFNTTTFITKAKEVHGSKFNYSKVNYTTSNTKVIILCPDHGEYEQTPNNHLFGYGCKLCGKSSTSTILKLTTVDFISKAKKAHANKYDYSKVSYISSTVKVTLSCKRHGDWETMPYHHLSGSGCPMCHEESKCLSLNDFISNAKKIHGEYFDYSKSVYKNNNTKIIISCPEHGDFEQLPRSHTTKSTQSGCPLCNAISLWDLEFLTEEQKAAPNGNYILVLEDVDTKDHLIKLGISNNLKRRVQCITRESLYNYKVIPLSYIQNSTEEAIKTELKLHKIFSKYQEYPRYDFAGKTECFDIDILDEIVSMDLIKPEILELFYDGQEIYLDVL